MPIPDEWLKYAPKPKALGANEKWNVFLSYRSVNRFWVLNLYDVLKELDYKVFLDQYELLDGDELIAKLQDGLAMSQAGVLIWSTAAADSKWVFKEFQTMETRATNDEKFRFVPVKLDGQQLPVFAQNRVFEDFSSYPDGPNGGELLRLVYAITGQTMSAEAIRFANDQTTLTKDIITELNAAKIIGDAEGIIKLAKANTLPWRTNAAIGCTAAENLIKLKKNDEAIEILECVVEQFPKSIRPKQLHALALARKAEQQENKEVKLEGFKQAQIIMAKLYVEGERDPETMGIFARTWMNRYELSGDINELKKSRDLYVEGFEKAPYDYYTGINAAAKSVLIGTEAELTKGAAFAKRVEEITGTKEVPGDYWRTATIAEVFLIQKNYPAAGDMFQKAVAMALEEKGSLESTYKQACRLMEKLQPSAAEQGMIKAAFEHLLVKS
ncbi:hypothetical protein A3860_13650 [Niastella vici]|uniref:TIR domain-containing protein n=1 Tax=Niastella vici TaxID=1703345 RepID=A0A1V9G7K4_9BACT|nr:toll/interleukin-1 receptor domain-containing protein [Niastella vici]OQP66524.1 hypothetical protein A3860_13650 [Niastella vici]